MKNILLILLGYLIVTISLLTYPLTLLISEDDLHRPWTDGLFKNFLRARKKYDLKSYLYRYKTITLNPKVVLEKLRLLSTKRKVIYRGLELVDPKTLVPGHWVSTTHKHHRDRVDTLKRGGSVSSDYGSIKVVDNKVHDGNHRLAAHLEAGVPIVVEKWETVI